MADRRIPRRHFEPFQNPTRHVGFRRRRKDPYPHVAQRSASTSNSRARDRPSPFGRAGHQEHCVRERRFVRRPQDFMDVEPTNECLHALHHPHEGIRKKAALSAPSRLDVLTPKTRPGSQTSSWKGVYESRALQMEPAQ
jgi:hypothetical protein